MAWTTLYETDRMDIRLDRGAKQVLMEFNSGGLVPSYVTLHLNPDEVEALEQVLRQARQLLAEMRSDVPLEERPF